jgi:hypothetical protein
MIADPGKPRADGRFTAAGYASPRGVVGNSKRLTSPVKFALSGAAVVWKNKTEEQLRGSDGAAAGFDALNI